MAAGVWMEPTRSYSSPRILPGEIRSRVSGTSPEGFRSNSDEGVSPKEAEWLGHRRYGASFDFPPMDGAAQNMPSAQGRSHLPDRSPQFSITHWKTHQD